MNVFLLSYYVLFKDSGLFTNFQTLINSRFNIFLFTKTFFTKTEKSKTIFRFFHKDTIKYYYKYPFKPDLINPNFLKIQPFKTNNLITSILS